MEQFLKKHYKLLVVLILAFFTAVSVLNAKNDSAIFDETAHIPAGFSYVTQHDMRLNPEHPPLLKDLAGLSALIFAHPKFDTTQSYWTTDINGQWDAGHNFLYQNGNNADAIIFWSRLPIVLISVIFGLFIFLWAKEIAGIAAGLFALLLYACDPNILGHNHYVTTDLGIAAFLAFAMYFFLKFIKNPSWKNAFWGGIFLGLVHTVKFSSVIILPIMGLLLIFYPLIRKISYDEKENRKFSKRLAQVGMYLLKGIFAFAVSMAVVWIIFFANTYKEPKEVLTQTIEYYFPADDPGANAQITRKALLALNQTNIGRPMSEYVLGVAMVFKRVAGGNGAYFLGQVSNKAFIDYFPVVFIIKETIPFLFLIIFSLGYSIVQTMRAATKTGKHWFKERFMRFLQGGLLQYSLFGFIAFYAYISITGNLNIGFRHLFPILPFAYILITKKTFDFLKNKQLVSKKAFRILFSIIIVWIMTEPLISYPYYMSYFNETVGGPKNGFNYVTDSNADWGQDLYRLKDWLDQHPEIDKIHVDYFGGGDTAYYLGNRYLPWSDNKRPIENGWYAISVNFRQGSIYDTTKPDNETYRWLLNHTPVDQVGTSILIYHITTPPVLQ
ncbi:MAG TPA: glycosyltransferase family 39 protein [Patescibacteria group bacterium]